MEGQEARLWEVDYTAAGVTADDSLLICAASAEIAAGKAAQFLVDSGRVAVDITVVKAAGTIDVF